MEAVIPRREKQSSLPQGRLYSLTWQGGAMAVSPQLIQLTGVAPWDLKSGTEAKSLIVPWGTLPPPPQPRTGQKKNTMNLSKTSSIHQPAGEAAEGAWCREVINCGMTSSN